VLARAGRLDQRLLVAVVKLGSQRWWKDAGEEEQEDTFGAWLDVAVAEFCQEAQDPGDDEWKPVPPVDVATMDQRDRLWLGFLVLRLLTADEITAAVEAGITDPEEVRGELARLAEFRDDGRSPASSDDGAGVGSPPVRPAGRRRARVPAR
jgi:hypothetical protein